ncbi:regulatory protein RecX [bacterium]|nr:regulatory protein RecX [bacterium]
MPRITAIEIQSKQKNRRSIFVDQEFICGLDQSIVAKLRLTTGQAVAIKELKNIVREEEINWAKEKCLRWLDHRARTRRELAGRLQQHGVEPEVSEAVLKRLQEIKLVDDEAYARGFIQERVRLQGVGRRRLRLELSKRGLDHEIIEMALQENVAEDENQACEAEAKRKVRTYARLPVFVARRRLIAFLSRKGFDFETINPIVRLVLPEE